MSTTTLATMPAAKLLAAIARAEAISSAICSEMIAAGRGYEKSSETRAKCDPLAMRANAASDALCVLVTERSDRRTYHGTDRPIRRALA